MADSEIIKHSDLVEEGAISKFLGQELKDLVAYLPTVEASLIKTFSVLKKDAIKFNVNTASLKDINALNSALKESAVLEGVYTKAQKTKIDLTNQQLAQQQIEKANKKDQINLLKAEILEMDKTVGTLQRVEAANTRLTLERKRLDTATAEGAKRLQEINKELDKNNKYIIDNSDQLKKQRLNVGNYAASIKEAFEGTGVIGESINKYLGIITLLSAKIEGVVAAITKKKEADQAATAATKAQSEAEIINAEARVKSTLATEAEGTATIETSEAEKLASLATSENTVAEERNIAVTEEAIIVEKTNKAALEGQVVATEAATVAAEGLGTALKKLATNPYVIAAIAIAALVKIVYDNVTATQEQKDAWDAAEEGLKAYSKAALVAGIDAKQLAKDIRALTLEEFKRQDLAIKALTIKAELRAQAALAREQANEEGKTTKQRIELQQKFIDFTRQANEKEREELELDVEIKRGFVEKSGKIASREQKKQLQEAIAALSANLKQTEDETRKAQKQVTTLIDKYNDETKKMLQEAQREELEQIDTFSQSKAERLKKQLDKELKLNQLETQQKVDNLKDQQKKLGDISPAYTDEEGVFHKEVDNRAQFQREILALQNDGAGKAKALVDKTNEEIAQLNIDFQDKSIESERKFREDLKKLDEAYSNLRKDNINQEQNNELQKNQFQSDNAKDKIDELREQRNYEISIGKEKYKLTLADLQKYFDEIKSLESDHYIKEVQRLNSDADFSKQNEQQKTKDAIDAIKEKYAKLKEEEDKAIRNKNLTPQEATKEIKSRDKDRAQNEAKEIEDVKRNSAEVITGINDKLNGALDKSDQDHLKKTRDTEKEKTDIAREGFENRKKFIEEEKKALDQITEGLAEGLQKRSELQQQADQRDIDLRKRSIEVETSLAAAGKQNSLAAELAADDKAQEKKLQDAKKAQKQQEGIAIAKIFYTALTNALEKGENTFKAFAEALGEAGAAKTTIAALVGGGFYEGTESLGTSKAIPFKNGKDDVLISAKIGERILGYEDSRLLADAGISNKELTKAGLMYANNDFDSLYRPQFNSANTTTTTVVSRETHDKELASVMRKEIRELKTAIENKPVTSFDEIGLLELVKTVRHGAMTERTRYNTNARKRL